MAKKDPTKTPRSRIKNALRQLWLRSRERATAERQQKYCCERCGVKKSMAKGREVKVQVHHRKGISWDNIVDYVYKELLCNPLELEVLCIDCHNTHHYGDKNEKA